MNGFDATTVDLLGWTGTSFILFGYYLNAKQSVISWIVWFLGNMLMLIYSICIVAWPQAALNAALLGLNVYGYIEWQKNRI